MERRDLAHALRTAIAAVASLLVARLFQMPESYWAAITTIIVLQSTLGAALNVSAQRLIGTAMGALAGAFLSTFAGVSLFVYGAGILFCGLICGILRLDRVVFRYAGITLTIILLIGRPGVAWVTALHRFIDISVGIVVGLLITAIWPEPKPPAA